jgi:hypothetical protein
MNGPPAWSRREVLGETPPLPRRGDQEHLGARTTPRRASGDGRPRALRPCWRRAYRLVRPRERLARKGRRSRRPHPTSSSAARRRRAPAGHARPGGRSQVAGTPKYRADRQTISLSPRRRTRIARRVVWGRPDDRELAPARQFSRVDLPTLGRPASATKPLRLTSCGPPAARLQRQHLPSSLVVRLLGAASRARRPRQLDVCQDRSRCLRASPGSGSAPSIGNESTSDGS